MIGPFLPIVQNGSRALRGLDDSLSVEWGRINGDTEPRREIVRVIQNTGEGNQEADRAHICNCNEVAADVIRVALREIASKPRHRCRDSHNDRMIHR
jgi:hypothetical protein